MIGMIGKMGINVGPTIITALRFHGIEYVSCGGYGTFRR